MKALFVEGEGSHINQSPSIFEDRDIQLGGELRHITERSETVLCAPNCIYQRGPFRLYFVE
ncbi:hypothetical protein Scep_011984 [Stephania cephalantha]|uniref:Uncharacterized protein n=1 Tax=Stephania cephalantha TaxID=152367 RepID=A0AAP0JE50_9MAGN